MGLTNQQYDMIMREYDSKRMKMTFELDRRRDGIYEKLPEIRDIDKTIAEESVRRARLAIGGDKSALDGLKEDNEALEEKKKDILIRNGYPVDYLQPKYSCPMCRDTGFIGNKRCDCFKKALSRLIYNDSNLSGILSAQNFDNFDFGLFSDSQEDTDKLLNTTPRGNIENVVSAAKDFIRNFDNSFNNLLIYGNTGVGKTFL